MVFTDGQPNIHPPLGLLSSLDCELEDLNVFFSISTFGYGDSIDANLLEKSLKREMEFMVIAQMHQWLEPFSSTTFLI